MKKNIVQRKHADKTREKILKTAKKLFAEQGFTGTSSLAIAKTAKVNEALIFHHFQNKENLWVQVKAYAVANLVIPTLNQEPPSLRSFLETAVEQRLSAFQQEPLLKRLLQWQRLEKRQKNLFSGNSLTPSSWLPAIQFLQTHNKIKKDIPPEFIMIWLMASVNVVIFDGLEIFNDIEKRNAYIEYILTGFELLFA